MGYFSLTSKFLSDIRVAKKRTAKRKRRVGLAKPAALVEDRRAEAVTVAWMLTMVATLGAQVVGAGVLVLLRFMASPPQSLQAFPGLMLFTAAITGLICILLTPLVYRFRRVPPPPGITTLAVTVSLLPLVIGVIMSIQ